MRYRVSHRTRYAYAGEVSISEQILRLEPRTTPWQTVFETSLEIDPEPSFADRFCDGFGNHARLITIEQPHREFSVEGRSRIEVRAANPPAPLMTPPWEHAVIRQQPVGTTAPDIAAFAFPSVHTNADDEIEAYARTSFAAGRPLLDACLDLNHRIFRDFEYDPAATNVTTRVTSLLGLRRGVCQDFSHLMLACLRALGLPGRYVSGYLLTHPPEGQEKLVGADASHAWISIHMPDHGWIDLDPTNDLIPMVEHITLAYGLDYADVAPVAGVVYGGGDQQLSVAVDVSRDE